jgi:hypothetical protein
MRLGRGRSETEVRFDFLIEMEAELAVQLPLEGVAAQHGTQEHAHNIEPPFEMHTA